MDVNVAEAPSGGASSSTLLTASTAGVVPSAPLVGRKLAARGSRERSPHRAADGPEVLPPAELARVRGDNCGGFQVGEIHILRALSSRPELENWRCKVLDWDQSAGRVGVEVEDGCGTIRVKSEVLRKSVFVNDFRGVSAS